MVDKTKSAKKSVKVTCSAKAAKPAPTKSVSASVTKSTKSLKVSLKAATPAKPAKATKSVKVSKPAVAKKSVKAEVVATKPAKVAKDVKSAKVVKDVKAVKETKSAKAASKKTKSTAASVKPATKPAQTNVAKVVPTTPAKKSKKPAIIIATLAVVLLAAIVYGVITLLPCCHNRTRFDVVSAKDAKERVSLHLEIADNDEARLKGLMGRENLPENTGMLFDFEEPSDDYAMWMKDTLVPLDMVFLNNHSKVIALAPDRVPMTEDLITPCSVEYEHAVARSKNPIDEDAFFTKCEAKYAKPARQTRYVIELPAGTIKANGIRVGDILLKK